MLVIEQISSIGGGTGMPLPGLSGYDPAVLTADTYWAALTVAVLAIGGVYLLLRSRIGLVLTAIRDDERAARSSGVRVGLARMGVFIAAAAGCGAAGGVLAIEQLQVVPGTAGGVFSVQWTAEMAFAVIIGGIGTIEGPILGTIVYMVLQQKLQSYNAWYLIVLGIVAIAIALFARRGLWGTVVDRFNIRLFPVGYHLWAPGERRGRKRARGARRLAARGYRWPCAASSLEGAARAIARYAAAAVPGGTLPQGRQWLTCFSAELAERVPGRLRRPRPGSPRSRRSPTRCAPRAWTRSRSSWPTCPVSCRSGRSGSAGRRCAPCPARRGAVADRARGGRGVHRGSGPSPARGPRPSASGSSGSCSPRRPRRSSTSSCGCCPGSCGRARSTG